jgi:hypothetical protein
VLDHVVTPTIREIRKERLYRRDAVMNVTVDYSSPGSVRGDSSARPFDQSPSPPQNSHNILVYKYSIAQECVVNPNSEGEEALLFGFLEAVLL